MPALKGLSRKPKPNPYSQRGLDQFALVSAELQAARDRLSAQLGTSLSLIRFTNRSDQNKWIPIIVAAHTSSKDEMRALRRTASELVSAEKLHTAEDLDRHTARVSGSLLKHWGSSISEYSTHDGDVKENNRAQKTDTNKVVKSSTSTVDATASRVSPEKLGQALSGAGLVLVLVGLVMGYIPAIVSVVCWWYALPSMRKAIGDKPFVKSHHLHPHGRHEGKSNTALRNEARGTNIVASVKDDMELKKKVIMDGLLERRRHHSHV